MLKIQRPQNSPLKWLEKALMKWTVRDRIKTFEFRQITTDEMIRSISKLSNSTAFGLDKIDAVSIKLAASQLVLPLKHLVNSSLKHSSYATKWKTAKVIPLLKSNELNRLDPASYRPVAILPVFSKLVERSAQLQLLKFLEESTN